MSHQRFINLDWLEVFCYEHPSFPCTPEHFRKGGYYVRERDHGTPQYKQMFEVRDKYSRLPLIEVRRLPYSVKSSDNPSGLFREGACHIRLANRACYFSNPAEFLRTFLRQHALTYVALSRVDICCDFQRFDSGDFPKDFMQRYMEGRYRKINQIELFPHAHETNVNLQAKVNELAAQLRQLESFIKAGGSAESQDVKRSLASAHKKLNVLSDYAQVEESAHAVDLMEPVHYEDEEDTVELVKEWNYICWRSDSSPVGTKIYNKTKELDREGHRKQYIKQQWEEAYKDGSFRRDLDVFRLEFSLRSQCKGFVRTYDGEMLQNDLDRYCTKEGLLAMFVALCSKYFQFVHTSHSKSGKLLSKSRSPKKELFHFSEEDSCYQNLRKESKADPQRKLYLLMNALNDIIADDGHYYKRSDCDRAQILKRSLAQRFSFSQFDEEPDIARLSDRKVCLTPCERQQLTSHLSAIEEIYLTRNRLPDDELLITPDEADNVSL